MKVTIKDVAKRANVSPSTVSRVVHNSPKISTCTKEIVNKAMDELNYHPNAIARSLAKASTRTLGLILPNDPNELFINPFFIKTMRGLSIYAQKRGYYLMYSFSKNEEEEVDFLKDYVNSNWVEGIILFTSRHDDKCIAYLKSKNFPFVVIGRPEDTKGTLWVDNDNFQAMYNVVNYLIQKGHKEIAFIGGPITFNVTQNRLSGYKQALLNRGLEIDPEIIRTGTDFAEETGYESFREILAARTPDAVVTTDDMLAFGVLKAAAEMNHKSAVIGFNNTLRSAYQKPGLTSIDINPDELGVKAGKLIIDFLENNKQAVNHFVIDTLLIERESTADPV